MYKALEGKSTKMNAPGRGTESEGVQGPAKSVRGPLAVPRSAGRQERLEEWLRENVRMMNGAANWRTWRQRGLPRGVRRVSITI
jgi:hypothetical protein